VPADHSGRFQDEIKWHRNMTVVDQDVCLLDNPHESGIFTRNMLFFLYSLRFSECQPHLTVKIQILHKCDKSYGLMKDLLYSSSINIINTCLYTFFKI
jgi:hypothetical protein